MMSCGSDWNSASDRVNIGPKKDRRMGATASAVVKTLVVVNAAPAMSPARVVPSSAPLSKEIEPGCQEFSESVVEGSAVAAMSVESVSVV